MNNTDVIKLVSIIKSQYQHKFIIEAMTYVTWEELLNAPPAIPFDAAKSAAMTWMRDNDWPPSVKDLRDIIASQVVGIPDADAAWKYLQDWLRAGYPGMTVDKRPPLPELIGATVKEMGGTSTIREMGEKARTKFDHVYNRLRRDEVQAANVTESWDRLTAVESGTRKAIA